MGVEVDGKGGVGVDVVLLQWPMGELEVMQRRTDCTSVAATALAPFLQPHLNLYKLHPWDEYTSKYSAIRHN